MAKHPTGKHTKIGTNRINSCTLESHKVETYMVDGQMAASSSEVCLCLGVCIAGWDHVRPLSAFFSGLRLVLRVRIETN